MTTVPIDAKILRAWSLCKFESLQSHTAVGSRVRLPCYVQKTLFSCCPPPPGPLQSFYCCVVTELWEKGCTIDVQLGQNRLPLFAPWLVVGFCVNHQLVQKKPFWWRLRETLIFRYSSKSLGVGFIAYSFRRILVVGYSLGPTTSLTKDSWLW